MTTTQPTSRRDVPARAGAREWTALGVLALPALLVSIDVFVLLLALPSLSSDLGATATQQLWILDVYGFMLAGFMLTAGTLGDRIGRRRLLLIGGAAFGVASIVAALSTGPLMLIVARGALGIAGATLAPSTLALISNLFRDPAQRAQAIGVWLVCFMGGAALGPVVGGIVLEHFWWGAAFLLGVPVMVLLLILGPLLLPEYRDATAGRIDLASVALSLAAILPFVFGVKELARAGWAPLPALGLTAGIAFGVAFARRQLRLTDPVLDLRLFRNHRFSAGVGGMLLIASTGVTMYLVTQYLQLVRGMGPLEAGIATLPGVVASITGFLVSPLLARRVRPGVLIASGMAVAASGVVVLTQAGVGGPLTFAVLGYALFQLGCGPMVTLGTDLVVGSAPPEKAGSAAAASESSGELGYGLGIAVVGSVAAAVYASRLSASTTASLSAADEAAARGSLAGAVEVARTLGDDALLDAAREAFLAGMRAGLVGVVGVMVGVAVIGLGALRHVPSLRQGHSSGASAPQPAPAGEDS
ncbi:major facilitator superfamily MFS_1 [Beutenbergia cavernae DSM 12333]|uniref:Major facilitator superfamily MFS_1 n=1 Tax=Beutenbergia cavernae (strain ATCC BAA-8 / DSM 12333 / CCUG 43141 / JCM 11478 / NBRC 16432 / NCIMB 13614 / HKI 0122) TaxID=471853 RepID=C5BX36_BEUC1|nr:MFS transporter [Beutenbergia cavernae]ACQ78711.1 major facilitator superfamily MFS_1 [Beutenbergia cavernae DSM 12333]